MFKNLSIKNKLASLFVGIILFFTGVIFYSIKQMDSVAAVADKLANDRIPKVMALAEISKNVNIIARAARNMYIFREKSMVDEEKNTILKSREIIGQKFDYLKPIIKNPKGKKFWLRQFKLVPNSYKLKMPLFPPSKEMIKMRLTIYY
ncbi:MAG: MCP four helix bundle domain-containing protein [Leptospiraceae bacterium]|nr:MCP four helix bundle domain-containing protein [Leptospiraceae bacterium]